MHSKSTDEEEEEEEEEEEGKSISFQSAKSLAQRFSLDNITDQTLISSLVCSVTYHIFCTLSFLFLFASIHFHQNHTIIIFITH